VTTEAQQADDDARPPADLEAELAALRGQVSQLRAENDRVLPLLELTPEEARPPGSVQTGILDAAPGPVHFGSPWATKVAFFRALFAARTDVYARHWENARSGESGWMPRSFPRIPDRCSLVPGGTAEGQGPRRKGANCELGPI
jgi:hypothetical protein